MSRSEERRLRFDLQQGLDATAERMRSALRGVVADSFASAEGRTLHFEVDPDSYRVTVGDADLLPGWWLHQALPCEWFERVENAGLISSMFISSIVLPWLADLWDEVGGRWTHSPAYVFWSGFEVRYDLESRRWLSVAEFLGGVTEF